MRRIFIFLCGFFLITTVTCFSLTIKLASIAPEQSPWGEALNKIAAEWKRISGGRVILKIYHNGIVGSEADMLRKIRIGQIHGGVFTSFGLYEVVPEMMTISYPFLIKTDAELEYILNKMKPILNNSAREHKLEALTWSKAGWIRIFSKNKIFMPQDLQKHTFASNPDDQTFSLIWEQLGYYQVPVAIPDILQSLNTGLIDAIWSSPLAAASFQWFGLVKNMTSMKITPFIGSILISEDIWKRVPADLKNPLMQVVAEVNMELDRDILELESKAISEMQKYGLVVNQITPQMEQAWAEEFGKGAQIYIRMNQTQDIYELIKKYLTEYKSK